MTSYEKLKQSEKLRELYVAMARHEEEHKRITKEITERYSAELDEKLGYHAENIKRLRNEIYQLEMEESK